MSQLLDKQTAADIAAYLLEIKAIKLQPQNPFTWASGWKSPIYCDNRISLSFPEVRSYITLKLAESIRAHFPKAECIAGVATAGIPQGALVADRLGLPFIYVRSKPKGHGMGNAIEGNFKKEQSVVMIEDLISTGGSSLKAAKALQEKGAEVIGMAAIFTYGFQVSEKNFEKAAIPLITLSNYNELITLAQKNNMINQKQLDSLSQWRKSPETWKG